MMWMGWVKVGRNGGGPQNAILRYSRLTICVTGGRAARTPLEPAGGDACATGIGIGEVA